MRISRNAPVLLFLALFLKQTLYDVLLFLRSGEKSYNKKSTLEKSTARYADTEAAHVAPSFLLLTLLYVLCSLALCNTITAVWRLQNLSSPTGCIKPELCAPSTPILRLYGGGTLAATPLYPSAISAFPVLLGKLYLSGVYFHRLYGPESEVLSSALEEKSVVVKLPLKMVIPSLTIKEMRRVASMHNISLSASCRTREQVSSRLLSHGVTCSCGSFASVIVSSLSAQETRRLCEPDPICSLDLRPHLLKGELGCGLYEFVAYDVPVPDFSCEDEVYAACPTSEIARYAPFDILRRVCGAHSIDISLLVGYSELSSALSSHVCSNSCALGISQFRIVPELVSEERPETFPPRPLSRELSMQIVHNFCKTFVPENIEERGCAVCGELTIAKDMRTLDPAVHNLGVLRSSDTRTERHKLTDLVAPLQGPILAPNCEKVCEPCVQSLAKGTIPTLSLANGLWLGEVPEILSSLSFAEKLLIARIRHNRCLVKVASGRSKMVANCVMYSNPMPQIYRVLPPPREDFEEVLAFLYIGSEPPTPDDFGRTPMLVRRNRVRAALEWLKLNHSDYSDIEISIKNLSEYPESGIPVHILSKIVPNGSENTLASELSVHDMDTEKGTATGPCPFTVSGVSGEELEVMSTETMKAVALKHLQSCGKVLAIGRSGDPVSMYDNPQSYPQMFPWLFPYGKGGIGQTQHKGIISEDSYKRHLLMYFDKRFQKDSYFPMVAFNHSQIKKAVTGSFLMAGRDKFEDVVSRLNRIDGSVLLDIIKRLTSGEHVQPQTEHEKLCYGILRDIDHVGGHVPGSLTSKKYMRNEVWSMTAFKGSPHWFVTLSPADARHPLCIYYAGTDLVFKPEIKSARERDKLIASNPVAAARFFHFMIQAFLKHILRWDTTDCLDGAFGKTSAYYGTVEQQGRLTLHLHLLIWVVDAMSPREIREKILAGEEDFQKALLEYLESCQKGEFLTGTMEDMKQRFASDSRAEGIHILNGAENNIPETTDPTLVLPVPPPVECCSNDGNSAKCHGCDRCNSWWETFASTVDHLLFKCNVHKCIGKNKRKSALSASHEGALRTSGPKGCLDNDGFCLARFPRDTREFSIVNKDDGHIDIKKREAMINTFLPLITFLFICNIDVSSLLSGSALKAAVAYVTDYITKQTLKTYQIFQSAFDILKIGKENIAGQLPPDGARRTILKIVNSLTTKTEIGSPFACLYLLGHPDRYSSHLFTNFAWLPFVKYATACWTVHGEDIERLTQDKPDDEDNSDDNFDEMQGEKLILARNENGYFAQTLVDDYIYRPKIYDGVNLYRWFQCASKKKRSKTDACAFKLATNPESEIGTDEKLSQMSVHREKTLRDSAFLRDHPLYLTHAVSFDYSKEQSHIPNFIGPPLPKRHEHLDDYYCSAMLTLFKPWRSGFDLKREGETWKSSFSRFKFSKEQRRKLEFFNLRYECYDARDEYAHVMKQRKAASGIVISRPGDVHDFGVDGDVVDLNDINIDNRNTYEGPEWEAMLLDVDGYKYSHLQHLQKTDSIANGAGFNAPSLFQSTHHFSEIDDILTDLSPARWKNVLKVAKETAIACKQAQRRKRTHEIAFPQSTHVFEGVRIVNQDFLNRVSTVQSDSSVRDIAAITLRQFVLNEDQTRAFQIVVNHVESSSAEQLKLYIGGMAGTGKSRVLNAIQAFFGSRNESYRVLVLAPTGSSAALISGFTYHSALGIGTGVDSLDGPKNDMAGLRRVRAQLEGVTHIFIDEISMIACHELYAISSRLSQATNVHDQPFGGLNVILAGDFAQLDPAKGAALFSGSVSMVNRARQKPREQMNIIGKVIWHQFITVVILKENMRQKNQSDEDASLRRALENMRYGSCTDEDIKFLRSRIVSLNPTLPNLSDPEFRNISVITPLNIQKDRLNEKGCIRFAGDTGQRLEHFYSSDTDQNGRCLPRHIQSHIWKLPANETDNIPGRISLCRGMPVMIRFNYATELCITRGQEAHVVSWTESKGPLGQRLLDTLFVRLCYPPFPVQVSDLPENVVPITRHTSRILISIEGLERQVSISRQQVQILPNFAMTDYAAQGKSRPRNPVNLTNCKNQHAVYTALSRSTTADGTLILGEFDTRKITSGISGHLRQEFRELELLNCITKDRFLNKLPCTATLSLRKPLIREYQLTKEPNFQPTWHTSLSWRAFERRIDQPEDTFLWGKKLNPDPDCTRKRRKKSAPSVNPSNEAVLTVPPHRPVGLMWDALNWSCAYDAVLSILYNVWVENRFHISLFLRSVSHIGIAIANGFDTNLPLEILRNGIRASLHAHNPLDFPWGQVATDLYGLVNFFLGERNPEDSAIICETCHNLSMEHRYGLSEYIRVQFLLHENPDVQSCLSMQLSGILWCSVCGKASQGRRVLGIPERRDPPLMIFIPLPMDLVVTISRKLEIEQASIGSQLKYTLRGIIYHGSNHFTCRYLDEQGRSWTIDGLTVSKMESNSRDAALLVSDGRRAVMATYMLT